MTQIPKGKHRLKRIKNQYKSAFTERIRVIRVPIKL